MFAKRTKHYESSVAGLADTGLTDTEPKWTYRHQHRMDLPTPDLPTQAIITGGLTDTAEKILKNRLIQVNKLYFQEQK